MSQGSTPQKSYPQRRFYGISTLRDYKIVGKLGEGTFGEVSKALQRRTGRVCALKKLMVLNSKDGFPITSFREVSILKKLKHKNVLQLVDMIYEKPEKQESPGIFYTVSPYMASDLTGLLNNPRVHLTQSQIKGIVYQMLEGINYVHQNHYFHRDIKASNILIDSQGIVKIADFGLARIYYGPKPTPNGGPGGYDSATGMGLASYTGLVVTRWYRPPELVLGDKNYTTSVDIWGIGCIFAELFKRKPILEGKTEIDQGHLIFNLCGPLTPTSFPNADKLPGYNNYVSARYTRTLEQNYRKHLCSEGLRLLASLLEIDPVKRINAVDALAHPYFKAHPHPAPTKRLADFEESHELDVKRFKEERKTTDLQPPPPQQSRGFHSAQQGYRKDRRLNNHHQNYSNGRNANFFPSGPRIGRSAQSQYTHSNDEANQHRTNYDHPRNQDRQRGGSFRKSNGVTSLTSINPETDTASTQVVKSYGFVGLSKGKNQETRSEIVKKSSPKHQESNENPE
ncbi:hypothetical protein LJB42_002915 [Komagataella kurtzmanii]|nr:hypothetical protein LJB42_002915 [Komagataella kurtzmanii]